MLSHMSKLLGIVTVAVSLTSLAQEAIPGPQVGERFPHDLSAPDQYGQVQTIATLMGEKGLAAYSRGARIKSPGLSPIRLI